MIDAEAEGHRTMKRWAMLEMQLRMPTMFYQRRHREIAHVVLTSVSTRIYISRRIYDLNRWDASSSASCRSNVLLLQCYLWRDARNLR